MKFNCLKTSKTFFGLCSLDCSKKVVSFVLKLLALHIVSLLLYLFSYENNCDLLCNLSHVERLKYKN